jgi:hypothetical protein
MRILLLACGVLTACGANSGTLVNMTLNTALAVGAAVAERSQGGCYAACGPGSVCNPSNGLCERFSCNGLCSEQEICDDSGAVPQCVADPSQAPSAPPLQGPPIKEE